MYVDAHQTTDSELRAWGTAHMPLWSALRARTFAVHVVAVGLGADAADRAAPLLKHWTQDGDGTGIDNPTWQTQADPDIRQEIARLKAGITVGDRADLDATRWIQRSGETAQNTAATSRRHTHQNDHPRHH